MIADKLSWKKFFKNGIINRKAVRSYGEEMVDQYQVLCKSQDVSIDSLIRRKYSEGCSGQRAVG